MADADPPDRPGQAQGHLRQPLLDPGPLRGEPRLRDQGGPEDARAGGARPRAQGHPRRGPQPHRLGQRPHVGARAVPPRRERPGPPSEPRLVRRGPARLRESAHPPPHGRRAGALAARGRPRRLPLRHGRPPPHVVLGGGAPPARPGEAGPVPARRVERPRAPAKRLRRGLRMAVPRRAHPGADPGVARLGHPRHLGGRAPHVPRGDPAPALLRQPRRAAGGGALRRSRGPGRVRPGAHPGRHSPRVQRHGGRGHRGVGRPGPRRAPADLLADRGAPARVPSLLRPDDRAPAGPRRPSSRRDGLAPELGRDPGPHLPAPGRSRGVPDRHQPVQPPLGGPDPDREARRPGRGDSRRPAAAPARGEHFRAHARAGVVAHSPDRCLGFRVFRRPIA